MSQQVSGGAGVAKASFSVEDLAGKARAEVSESVRAVLKEVVLAAVGDLAADVDLLALGAQEESICHRLAVYMERRTSGFHVDCEYNRYKTNPKRRSVANKRRLMKPDILLHRRLLSEFNAVALEAKANANPDSRDGEDVSKLQELTDPQEMFHYYLGVQLTVYNERDEVIQSRQIRLRLRWCVDTKWIGEETVALPVTDDLIEWLKGQTEDEPEDRDHRLLR